MRLIGYSTGALAYSDFRLGLKILRTTNSKAVELSALREHELAPLIAGIDSLDLSDFTYVSVHAPSKYESAREKKIISLLGKVAERNWPIVLHPDTIHDFSAWHTFGHMLFIENMDKRNLMGRTTQELSGIFDRLPQAKLCFDLGHCRQVDPTMNESHLILQNFGTRLGQLHMSEVNSRSTHDPLSSASIRAFEKISQLVPEEVPIILESPVPAKDVNAEIENARAALPSRKTTNGTPTRGSRSLLGAAI
jgi:hypothetical protein